MATPNCADMAEFMKNAALQTRQIS